MLRKTGGPSPSELHSFEKHWPTIHSIFIRLICNQDVSKAEWQSLFHDVHMICSWDEKGCIKLLTAIEAELLKSIVFIARERLLSIQDGQQQLKEYIDSWLEYKRHCARISVAFQQLDLAAGRKGCLGFLMLKLWRNHVIVPLHDRLQEPELLANHCDLLFRRTTFSRKYSPEEISERLDEVMSIIKFNENKDTLIKYHRILLTRRLLLDTTLDIEFEKSFLAQLKDISDMPFEQLTKLDRMIKDLKSSKELLQQYRKSMELIHNNNNNTIPVSALNIADLNLQENNNKMTECHDHIDEIDVKILNPSAWPKAADKLPISLPNEVISMMPSFETFYNNQYPGRKLDWCPQLSTATIAFCTDNGGKFDLDLTAAQLAILSVYNNSQSKTTQTFKDLEKDTNLESSELKRSLWSLVLNPRLKIQLILCEPMLGGIKDIDNANNNYRINQDFMLV